MPTRPPRTLPAQPDIAQLRRQAKELQAAFVGGRPDAVGEVALYHPGADATRFALHDALLVIARAHGFTSWPRLKARLDGVTAAGLCAAAARGDVGGVRAMLERRPEIVNLTCPHRGELRALHIAVMRSDLEMARLLLRYGADARAGIWPHRDATRPATMAAERGQKDIADAIAEEEKRRGTGAPPDGGTPQDELLSALRGGEQQALLALLQRQPAQAAAQIQGATVLHLAAGLAQDQVVAWVLAHGADASARDDRGLTALDWAACGGTAGTIASPERFAATAAALRRHGAPLTAVAAVALGETEAIATLHRTGALHNPERWGSPFPGLVTVAVIHRREDVLAQLLQWGFDPDERVVMPGRDAGEEPEYTAAIPLYACAKTGDLALARVLLGSGADPNANVYAAGSPVHIAQQVRDGAMIALLERHGGVVTAETAGYHRLTDLARRMLEDEAAGRLRLGAVPAGATVAEELLKGDCGDPEIVRLALEHLDWDPVDHRWHGILWNALCFWNHMPGWPHPDLPRDTYLTGFRLILARSRANAHGPFGRTILHDVAAMRPWVTDAEVTAFAAVLLDAGARTAARDELLCSTPLGWACRWGRTGMVRLLLQRGADPVEAEAPPWAMPRAWAGKAGHAAALALLGEHGG